MSSRLSYLTNKLEFDYVEEYGLNEEELACDPRLNHYYYFMQNLNANPKLSLASEEFDAVLNCVSV